LYKYLVKYIILQIIYIDYLFNQFILCSKIEKTTLKNKKKQITMAQPNTIQITKKNKHQYEKHLINEVSSKCQEYDIIPSEHLTFLMLQAWKQPASNSALRGDIRDGCIKSFFSAIENKNSGKTPTFANTQFTALRLGSYLCDDLFNFMTLLFDSYSFNINDIVYIINLILTWTNRFPTEKSQVKADIVWNFLHRSFFKEARPLALCKADFNEAIRHMRSIVHLNTDKRASSVRNALMNSSSLCDKTLHELFQSEYDPIVSHKFILDTRGQLINKHKFSHFEFGYYLLIDLPVVYLQSVLENSTTRIDSIIVLYNNILVLIQELFSEAKIIVESPTKRKKVKLNSGDKVIFQKKEVSYSGEIVKEHKSKPRHYKIQTTDEINYNKIPLADIELQSDTGLEPIKNKSKKWKDTFKKFRNKFRDIFDNHFSLSGQKFIPTSFEKINGNNPTFSDLNLFKNFGKLRKFLDFEKNITEIRKELSNTIECILIDCLINLNNCLIDLNLDINESYNDEQLLKIYNNFDDELIKNFCAYLDYAINIYDLIKSKQSYNINDESGETKGQSIFNPHDPFHSAYQKIVNVFCNYIEKLSQFRIQHRFSINYDMIELHDSIKNNNKYQYTPLQISLLDALQRIDKYCIIMSGPTGCGKTTAFSVLDSSYYTLFYYAPSGSVVEQFTANASDGKKRAVSISIKGLEQYVGQEKVTSLGRQNTKENASKKSTKSASKSSQRLVKDNQKRKQQKNGERKVKLNNQITGSLHNFSRQASDFYHFIPTIIHLEENCHTYISSGKIIIIALDEFDSLLVEANNNGSAGIYLYYFRKLLNLAQAWPTNKLKICLLGATLPTSLIRYIQTIMDNAFLEVISTERVAKNIICKNKESNDHPFKLREINANVLRTLPLQIRRTMFNNRTQKENTNDPGFHIRDAYLTYQEPSSSKEEMLHVDQESKISAQESFKLANTFIKKKLQSLLLIPYDSLLRIINTFYNAILDIGCNIAVDSVHHNEYEDEELIGVSLMNYKSSDDKLFDRSWTKTFIIQKIMHIVQRSSNVNYTLKQYEINFINELIKITPMTKKEIIDISFLRSLSEDEFILKLFGFATLNQAGRNLSYCVIATNPHQLQGYDDPLLEYNIITSGMLDSSAITSQIFGRISRANQKIGKVICDYDDYIRYISYSPENNTTLDHILDQYNHELWERLTNYKIEISRKTMTNVHESIRACSTKRFIPRVQESKSSSSTKMKEQEKEYIELFDEFLNFIQLEDLDTISLYDLLVLFNNKIIESSSNNYQDFLELISFIPKEYNIDKLQESHELSLQLQIAAYVLKDILLLNRLYAFLTQSSLVRYNRMFINVKHIPDFGYILQLYVHNILSIKNKMTYSHTGEYETDINSLKDCITLYDDKFQINDYTKIQTYNITTTDNETSTVASSSTRDEESVSHQEAKCSSSDNYKIGKITKLKGRKEYCTLKIGFNFNSLYMNRNTEIEQLFKLHGEVKVKYKTEEREHPKPGKTDVVNYITDIELVINDEKQNQAMMINDVQIAAGMQASLEEC